MKALIILGALTVLILQTRCAAADTFPCVELWGGPSANNSLTDCYSSSKAVEDWITYMRQRVALIALPLLLGLGALFACPFVFCARYCCQCCGGSKMRPDGCCCGSPQWDDLPEDDVKAEYGAADVACAKYSTVLLILIAAAFVALVYVGGTKFGLGIQGIYEGLTNTVNFFLNLISSFRAGCQRPDGTNPINQTDFQTFEDKLNDILNTYNGPEVAPYRDLAKQVGLGLSYSAALPALLILLMAVCAFCHVRACCPCCLNCGFFLLCFLYGFAGFLFLTLHLPLDIVCGEVQNQLDRKPSIMQWYVVPKCEQNGFLSHIQDTMNDAERTAAQQACNSIQQFCSSSAYPATPTIQFNCNTAIGNCTTFAGVDAFAATLSLKVGAAETCGAAPGGGANCTLRNCAEYCVDSDLRNQSASALSSIEDASRIVNSFNTNVAPWLSCNTLLDRLVDTATPMCSNLPLGLYLMGIGCTVAVVTMLVSVCVTCRGEKRWFAPIDKDSDGYYKGDRSNEMKIFGAPMNATYSPDKGAETYNL